MCYSPYEQDEAMRNAHVMVQQVLEAASSSREDAITLGRLEPDIIPDRVDGSVLDAKKLA